MKKKCKYWNCKPSQVMPNVKLSHLGNECSRCYLLFEYLIRSLLWQTVYDQNARHLFVRSISSCKHEIHGNLIRNKRWIAENLFTTFVLHTLSHRHTHIHTCIRLWHANEFPDTSNRWAWFGFWHRIQNEVVIVNEATH